MAAAGIEEVGAAAAYEAAVRPVGRLARLSAGRAGHIHIKGGA